MTKPRIVIDARMVGPTAHGIARYVRLLARGLAERARNSPLAYEPVLLVAGQQRGERLPLPVELARIEVDAPFLSVAELVELPRVLERTQAALYHSPSFSSLVWSPCPWVMTVHDLCHRRYGDLARRLYYRTVLRPFARRARALMTVSEASRDELAAWLSVAPEAITVAANALEPSWAAEDEVRAQRHVDRLALPWRRYFFSAATAKAHKGRDTLLAGYAAYRAQTGSGAWPLVLASTLDASLPGVMALGAVDDETLHALYVGSAACVTSSLYEGFGLPPVEAASLGTPALATRIPSHEEGLALLPAASVAWMPPGDPTSLAQALVRVQGGGIERVPREVRTALHGRYSVARLADTVDAVYRSALGQG